MRTTPTVSSLARRRQWPMALALLLAFSLLGTLLASPRTVEANATPFTDIDDSPFIAEIEWLYAAEITSGCTDDQFCPLDPVTREQMASFLVRALFLTDGAGDNLFDDDDDSSHELDIDVLGTSGITTGCDVRLFCPSALVLREQMASFLVRAFDLADGAGDNLFDDDDDSSHELDIDVLATSGITTGCDTRLFCPTNPVTREQMAAFLYRSFHNEVSCDQALASNSTDAHDAAKAIGLCARFGLQSAIWTLPAGGPMADTPTNYHLGHSLRDGFGTGIFPREGVTLVVLSTGAAADKADALPPYAADTDKGYTSALPSGWPLAQVHLDGDGGSQECPDQSSLAADGVALEVTVQAPPGATAMSFDWKYFSLDYPDWICSQYVDAAAVLVDGSNAMTFAGHTVTANTVMEVCESGSTGTSGGTPGTHICAYSTAELDGTGFNELVGGRMHGGASAWHTTTVPVTPGVEYTLTFGIWDAADGTIKSTVLFDNFNWVD